MLLFIGLHAIEVKCMLMLMLVVLTLVYHLSYGRGKEEGQEQEAVCKLHKGDTQWMFRY